MVLMEKIVTTTASNEVSDRRERWLPLKAIIQLGFLCCALFFHAEVIAAPVADEAPLPPEQAFVFSMTQDSPTRLSAQWQIAPGYYLYRDRVRIDFPASAKADVNYPQGEFKYAPDRGRYEAYAGYLTIPILLQTSLQEVTARVAYQGCSQYGFCYPPVIKTLRINLKTQVINEVTAFVPSSTAVVTGVKPVPSNIGSNLLTDQVSVARVLAHLSWPGLLLVFAGLGLLLSLTPCVLPMVPILTSIVLGHHAQSTQSARLSSHRAFFLSLTYVLGAALAYAGAGVLAALMGQSLQVWLQQTWIIVFVSGLFLLLALSLFDLYELQLPQGLQTRLTVFSQQMQGGRYFGVFLMGILSVLIISPCVTAPLIGVLMYIAQTGNVIFGASALFVMGLGMGLPLLIIGTSVGRWLPKTGAWMLMIKKLLGLLMVAMSLWLVSRVISPMMSFMLWRAFFLGATLFLAVYVPLFFKHSRVVSALVGGAIAVLGVVAIAGVSLSFRSTQPPATFNVVASLASANQQLALAQALHKPVILDFYADWCESCVDMDRNVFEQPMVQQALSQYVLIRADLSANSQADADLMKHFSVIAPPTILFFNGNGQAVAQNRIDGEVNAAEFLHHLSLLDTTNEQNTLSK